ncbi:hypothetical protein BS17DRAFT_882629 [Gyrodon lividus]|nr:hypothetical protein BS17DRAFT_882629 [Gyrodon lividus]
MSSTVAPPSSATEAPSSSYGSSISSSSVFSTTILCNFTNLQQYPRFILYDTYSHNTLIHKWRNIITIHFSNARARHNYVNPYNHKLGDNYDDFPDPNNLRLPRLSSTDAAGSTVFVTTTLATAIPTSVPPTQTPTPASSSSHTAAIVGGVVGGVVGIALLILFIFCIRRKSKKDDFDGDFDPDRVIGHSTGGGGTLPQVDLSDEVTPYLQQYGDRGGSMRQYGESPYFPDAAAAGGAAAGAAMPGRATSPLTSPSRYSDATSYHHPTGASSAEGYPQGNQFVRPGGGPIPGAYQQPVNMYGAGPADWHTPNPLTSPAPSTVASHTTTATSSRSAKEREALARNGQGAGTRTGLGLATQHEAPEGSGEVVVHQDAGRAPSDEQPAPREIPPAYESIRQ